MAGSGEVKETELENQDWIKRWDAHTIGFHKEYIHPYVNFFHMSAYISTCCSQLVDLT